MKNVLKIFAILAIIGGIAFVLSLFFDLNICVVYNIIGLPCPACGMTRAFMSAAKLNFRQAFSYHPLFFLVPIIPFFAWERIPKKFRDIFCIAMTFLFFAVWIFRIIIFAR